MTFPRPRTVRAKLTLTTVVALAVLCIGLGYVVQVVTWRAMIDSVDSELTRRGEMTDRMSHRGPGRGPGPDPAPDFLVMRILAQVVPGYPGFDDDWHRDREFRDKNAPRAVWASNDFHDPMRRDVAIDPEPVAEALKGKSRLTTIETADGTFRVLTKPVYGTNGNGRNELLAIVQIPASLTDYQKSLASLNRALLVVLPIGLILVGGASLFLVGRAMGPVRVVTETASRIGAEDLKGRLPVVGDDEFALLATTINGMLGRLEDAFLLQEATLRRLQEVIQQQRRFTADASHELKTPLSVVKVHASFLKNVPEEAVQESAGAIDAAASRMNKLVGDLLLLARTDAGSLLGVLEPCDLGEIATHASALVPGGSKIRLDVPEVPVLVAGQADALERLLINLLSNACRHTEPDGRVTLTLCAAGERAVVDVKDDGEGISSEDLPHIFERFFRADRSRTSSTGGTGLGLAICQGIVEAHGGTITVESTLGVGTRFTIEIPTLSAVVPSAPAALSA